MTTTKNQHFVPQTYLRTFADNASHLWVYDKAIDKTFESRIKKIASQKHFYDHDTLDKGFGDKQWLEKRFAELERHYPIIVKKLQVSNWTVDDAVKEYFAAFVTYQMFRTIEARKRHDHFRKQASQLFKDDPNSLKHYGLNLDLSAHDGQIYFLLSNWLSKFITSLQSWTWIVTINRTATWFITSDNPVIRITPTETNATGTKFHLPLTPRRGLLVMDSEASEAFQIREGASFMPLNQEWARVFNELQAMQSYRQLFSRSDDFDHVREFMNRWPQLKNVDEPKYFMKAI
jgi:hypothetical protein